VVYRARQIGVIERLVAVKLLSESSQKNDVVVKRFETEAQIIAQLRHPNTLKLVDSGRLPDGRLYVVTELLSGESLDRILERGAIEPMRVVRIMREVCDSLSEAHERGIIHRDLKPANLVLERVGALEVTKVLDFGIAKILSVSGLTSPATLFGTPGYMSPEQCRAETVDARSDIYSLGATAYHMLSGAPPYGGGTALEIVVAQIQREPTRLAEVARQSIPPALLELVERMMARRREDRPESVLAIRAELKLIEHQGAAPPPWKDVEAVTAPLERPAEPEDETVPGARDSSPPESLDTVIEPGPLTPQPDPPTPIAPPARLGSRAPVRPRRRQEVAIATLAVLVVGAVVLGWSRLTERPSPADADPAPPPATTAPAATAPVVGAPAAPGATLELRVVPGKAPAPEATIGRREPAPLHPRPRTRRSGAVRREPSKEIEAAPEAPRPAAPGKPPPGFLNPDLTDH
jgi:serine/threonine-protein kinase